MSMLDRLRKEKLDAYKNKDSIKNGVLSLVVAAMVLKEKETHEVISDEEAMTIIQKELKQTKESLALTPANREDLIALEKTKIALLESYLPSQLSLEDVKAKIALLLQQENMELTIKNKGLIIKTAMQALKGMSDGKVINEALALLFQESGQ